MTDTFKNMNIIDRQPTSRIDYKYVQRKLSLNRQIHECPSHASSFVHRVVLKSLVNSRHHLCLWHSKRHEEPGEALLDIWTMEGII